MEYVPLNPMTAALDSDKTVLVQSGSSLARDNSPKEKKDCDWYIYPYLLVHKTLTTLIRAYRKVLEIIKAGVHYMYAQGILLTFLV